MNIRSKPSRLYKGDNAKAIQAQAENGQWNTIFNLYPSKHGGYENDRFSVHFKTVKGAKDFAKDFLERGE